MAKEISFDRPPSGFHRRGQKNGALVVGNNPHSAKLNQMKEKLANQDAQIAELRAMVEELASKKAKKKADANS